MMKISKMTDYALVLVAELGRDRKQRPSMSASDLAAVTAIPLPSVQLVLKKLSGKAITGDDNSVGMVRCQDAKKTLINKPATNKPALANKAAGEIGSPPIAAAGEIGSPPIAAAGEIGSPPIAAARGRQGGYWLTRPLDKISVYDVLIRIEGPLAITDCVEGAVCCYAGHCRLMGRWHGLNRMIEQSLMAVSVADLLNDDNGAVAHDSMIDNGNRASNDNRVYHNNIR